MGYMHVGPCSQPTHNASKLDIEVIRHSQLLQSRLELKLDTGSTWVTRSLSMCMWSKEIISMRHPNLGTSHNLLLFLISFLAP